MARVVTRDAEVPVEGVKAHRVPCPVTREQSMSKGRCCPLVPVVAGFFRLLLMARGRSSTHSVCDPCWFTVRLRVPETLFLATPGRAWDGAGSVLIHSGEAPSSPGVHGGLAAWPWQVRGPIVPGSVLSRHLQKLPAGVAVSTLRLNLSHCPRLQPRVPPPTPPGIHLPRPYQPLPSGTHRHRCPVGAALVFPFSSTQTRCPWLCIPPPPHQKAAAENSRGSEAVGPAEWAEGLRPQNSNR